MHLSERLKCVSGMVKPCRRICDIGTDHAYIPIDLIIRGITPEAIASDLKKGPCQRAECNIARNNLKDKIEVRQGSGFLTIYENECDAAVIAGLGGNLMIDIFQKGGKIPQNLKQIVIQPQNVLERVRKYLYGSGYDIDNEVLVIDDNKFYTVMSVKYTGKPCSKDDIRYYIGEKLIVNNDRILPLYIDKEINRINKILENTEDNEYKWLLKEYTELKEKIKYE